MSLIPAHIQWRDNQALAIDYDDIYFSADGVREVERVFLQPSGVLDFAAQQPCVCVAELGFGTGLNFAVTTEAILKHSSARLHFISFEKHPLAFTDWQQVKDLRGQALPIYTELAAQPLAVLPGWHQRSFAQGRITLSVYHGDVLEGLTELAARQANPVDAWFLDGFAPSKNPDMWLPEIYAQLAELAHAATTVATFTSAGHVRRGLQAAGFAMQRIDQQPFKRESLAGRYQKLGRDPAIQASPMVVHGAGIAGAFMARTLAEQGCEVQVYDPTGIATGASAMSATVLHSRLLGSQNDDALLRVSAFHYAVNRCYGYQGFTQTGVLQCQGPNLDAAKLQRISDAYGGQAEPQQFWLQHVNGDQATTLAELKGSQNRLHDALYFPTAGVLDIPVLCHDLLSHSAIALHQEQRSLDDRAAHIICTASEVRRFEGCEHLEVTDVHGQLDWYTSQESVAALPVVGNGYLMPTSEGCVLGASYEYSPWDLEKARAHNLQMNQHLLARPEALVWQRSARGARAVASDRSPIIGSLNTPARTLWLATALGSMGTTAAPLAAAMVGAELLGWMPPVSPDVSHLTRPARFAERQARRGVRHIKPL